MTSPSLYRRACEVFASVLDVPEKDRAAAIDSACGTNSDLRAEVLRMVSGDVAVRENNFLASDALLDAADLLGQEHQNPER